MEGAESRFMEEPEEESSEEEEEELSVEDQGETRDSLSLSHGLRFTSASSRTDYTFTQLTAPSARGSNTHFSTTLSFQVFFLNSKS